MSSWRLEETSDLPAPPATVWAHAITLRGVNRELFPLARMTAPAGAALLDADHVALGTRLFRSWVLFLGLLPVDFDDLTVVELEPGRRFLERSPMLTQREWQHERIVEPHGTGTRITDRVTFVPRVPLLAPFHLATFRMAFRLRHRNLRRIFSRRR